MDVWYDDDLPEIQGSLLEFIKESKDLIALAGKFVGIPTGLFILTCIANRWIDKKIGSL